MSQLNPVTKMETQAELCRPGDAAPGDDASPRYLSSQNQFIGKEEPLLNEEDATRFPSARRKDLSPLLISFPFHMLLNPR